MGVILLKIDVENKNIYVVIDGEVTKRKLPDYGSIKFTVHNGELKYIEYESKEKIK